MPKGPDRDRAVLVANAVTFDLIGINKAIRKAGAEDPACRGVRKLWLPEPSGRASSTSARHERHALRQFRAEAAEWNYPAQAEAQRWFNVLVDDIRDFLTLRPRD